MLVGSVAMANLPSVEYTTNGGNNWLTVGTSDPIHNFTINDLAVGEAINNSNNLPAVAATDDGIYVHSGLYSNAWVQLMVTDNMQFKIIENIGQANKQEWAYVTYPTNTIYYSYDGYWTNLDAEFTDLSTKAINEIKGFKLSGQN